jgi:hypothetical protein
MEKKDDNKFQHEYNRYPKTDQFLLKHNKVTDTSYVPLFLEQL